MVGFLKELEQLPVVHNGPCGEVERLQIREARLSLRGSGVSSLLVRGDGSLVVSWEDEDAKSEFDHAVEVILRRDLGERKIAHAVAAS